VQRLDSGCCGLAGNFGFEAGHLQVSTDCAESVLLPALRSADPDAVVLADGFSCRTQIHELDSGGREAIHLAELLDRARRGEPRPDAADLRSGDRPGEPSRAARATALSGVITAAAGLAAVATLAARRRRNP
jgi:MYXO-CTERM domain-containing protein